MLKNTCLHRNFNRSRRHSEIFQLAPTTNTMAPSNANSAGSVSKLPPFELERFFAKYEFTAPFSAVRNVWISDARLGRAHSRTLCC
jgi:hypothetical protein